MSIVLVSSIKFDGYTNYECQRATKKRKLTVSNDIKKYVFRQKIRIFFHFFGGLLKIRRKNAFN